MPINYRDYHPDWKAISLRIRKIRAQDKCEWCGRENGLYYITNPSGKEDPWSGTDQKDYADICKANGDHVVRIVLTVAHLDRDKTNNDDSNLAALCQRCHLNHDRHQHAENRRNGRNWKRNQTKLEL
jgi:hypothetical protein